MRDQYSTSLMILLIAHIVLGAIILVQLDDTLQLLKDEMRNLWANRDKEASFWDSVQRGVSVSWLTSSGLGIFIDHMESTHSSSAAA